MPFFENAQNVQFSSCKFQEISGNVFVFNNASDNADVVGRAYNSIPANVGVIRPHTRSSRVYSNSIYTPVRNDQRNIERGQRQYTTPARIQHNSPHERGATGTWRNEVFISYAGGEAEGCQQADRSLAAYRRSSSPPKIQSTTLLKPYLQEVGTRSGSHARSNAAGPLIPRLDKLFSDIGEYRRLLSSQGSNAQKLLDIFQYILDEPETPADIRRELIVATQRLAAKSGLYPMSYELSTIITVAGSPEYLGGFGDVYKADLRGKKVCLKVIRSGGAGRVDLVKAFAKEAVLWSQLSHPNLLPFYGVYQFNNQVSLVSPWMEHGEISHYLREHPSADRLHLVFDIINGLSFLHETGIIHGDLKSPNILVDTSGRARLADFGLSSVSDSDILAWTSHSKLGSKGGSTRWQAPELFNPESEEVVHNTEASDIYAWSCVVYEVFSGKIPFSHLPLDPTVLLKVMMGERPARPPVSSPSWVSWGLNEDIWSLIEDCWQADPASRPATKEVISRLEPMLLPDTRTCEESAVLSSAMFRSSTHKRLDISVDTLDSLLGCRNSYTDGLGLPGC